MTSACGHTPSRAQQKDNTLCLLSCAKKYEANPVGCESSKVTNSNSPPALAMLMIAPGRLSSFMASTDSLGAAASIETQGVSHCSVSHRCD
jgi:hypothetical protein